MPDSPGVRVADRTIHNRLVAMRRDREYFDGVRANGYGGMKNDGRWAPVAKRICEEYRLNGQSWVLHIQCEKGYLLHELLKLHPTMRVIGTETSAYARNNGMSSIREHIVAPREFPARQFHFIMAPGIYTRTLSGVCQALRRIQKIGIGQSFVTLASYDTLEDLDLFRKWSLLAATVLKKDEWLEVLRHCKYTGDYAFVNAQTLGLCTPCASS